MYPDSAGLQVDDTLTGFSVCTRLTVRTTCLASHVVQPWLHICADLLQGTVLHSTLALLPTSLPTSKRVGLLEAFAGLSVAVPGYWAH